MKTHAQKITLTLDKSDVDLLLAAIDEYRAAVKRAGGRPSAIAMAMSEADLVAQSIRAALANKGE